MQVLAKSNVLKANKTDLLNMYIIGGKTFEKAVIYFDMNSD